MTEKIDLWRSYRLDGALKSEIERLAPCLVECEEQAVADRRLPANVADALLQSGFFHLSVVKEAGGREVHPITEFDVFETFARISVGVAWNVLIANIHTSWASAYLPDAAFAEVFPVGHKTVVAGQTAPTGRGEVVSGGYRVSGRWSWGSGISHSNWVIGGFVSEEGGPPLVFVVPKSSVDVLDNWHTIGIESSGSYDYELKNVFVSHDFTFPFLCTTPLRGGAKMKLPWHAQGAPAHSAVALGGAEHALEAISTVAANTRRSGQNTTLAERGAFQRDLGDAYTRLCAARNHAVFMFERMMAVVSTAGKLSEFETSQLTAMGAYANRLSVEVANTAFRYGGGASVRQGNPVQRALRDVLVAQQHVVVTDTSFEAVGEGIIAQAAMPKLHEDGSMTDTRTIVAATGG